MIVYIFCNFSCVAKGINEKRYNKHLIVIRLRGTKCTKSEFENRKNNVSLLGGGDGGVCYIMCVKFYY